MSASRKSRNPSGKGGFQKGQSGNPGGRRKETESLRDLCRGYTTEAVETLVGLMRTGGDKVKVQASMALLERGHGKPVQPLDGDGEGGAVRIAIEWLPPSD